MTYAAERAARMAAALVIEINAERGRQGLMSSRELGRRIGKSSQYISDRIDGGSPKTGRRTTLTVWDLAAMSRALGLTEVELIGRAERTMKVIRMQNDLTLMTGRLVGEDEAIAELDRIEAEKRNARPTDLAERRRRKSPGIPESTLQDRDDIAAMEERHPGTATGENNPDEA